MSVIAQPRVVSSIFSRDSRGNFSKPFPISGDESDFTVAEIFWTTSARGTIRGMHFQLSPAEIAKLVWVSSGAILDVLVDLRRHPGYGEISYFSLDASAGQALVVPSGFAHGFQALEENTIVNYATDGPFSPEHDTGVRWDSLEIAWPLPPGPISDRDGSLPRMQDFSTPFEVTR